jgi:hypothetical protein
MEIKFEHYVEKTEKLLNKSHEQLYKMYLDILDYNQDERLCEWDLFKTFRDMMTNDPTTDDLI